MTTIKSTYQYALTRKSVNCLLYIKRIQVIQNTEQNKENLAWLYLRFVDLIRGFELAIKELEHAGIYFNDPSVSCSPTRTDSGYKDLKNFVEFSDEVSELFSIILELQVLLLKNNLKRTCRVISDLFYDFDVYYKKCFLGIK